MGNLNPNNSTKNKPNKISVFLFLIIFIAMIYFLIKFIFGGSSTIGKYTKETLPDNFEYKIVKDKSNSNRIVEKNHLEVLINQKLTVGQIATLADELYNSKDKKRRFYIYYNLKKNEDTIIYWAISHFDPELEIDIIGIADNQTPPMLSEAKKVQGKIVGIFEEEPYTSALYTLYENDNKTYIKTSFKNGQSMIDEVIKVATAQGIKLIDKEEKGHGEYYILNDNGLEFYNAKNEVFTIGKKIL